jgi:2-oxoglutarate dehydrogenase complex dehydrogenase (E1) component-like enzyme
MWTNIFGKPVSDIFSEFDGKDYEQDIFFDVSITWDILANARLTMVMISISTSFPNHPT